MPEPLASFQWFYGVILALAITEALEEFAGSTDPTNAADGAKQGTRRFFTDSIPALFGLLVLVVPFFHGMNMYLQGIYRDRPSSPWLLLDAGVFMLEAVIIFLLSHNLQFPRWRTFYGWVSILLLIDGAWGAAVSTIHDARTEWWAIVNATCAAMVLGTLWLARSWPRTGAITCFVLLCLRTIADYGTSWEVYFPRA